MSHYLKLGKKPTGRPPVAQLTSSDLDEIKSLYVAGTNHSEKEGSMVLAWVRFCEDHPEKFGHLVKDHMPATTIPTAVVEACRQSRALIGPARGGAPRQRHEGAYVPGTMRMHHSENRRLRAGENVSSDDATRNVACYIPWPKADCECSYKFGVKLGRWQTLLVHDDAWSFIPFVSSVFRIAQSYRGTDVASLIYQAETRVCQFDNWSIEGGVWQSARPLAVLGKRWISAKGRPNQKLVENAIGRLWDIMAGQRGDVGRYRAEKKVESDLYVACRAGRKDPRQHFMSLNEAQAQLYKAVEYLCEKRMKSAHYGSWVPKDRWETDLDRYPRPVRNHADDFLIQPVAETRKVRGGMFKLQEDGPDGVPMKWTFTNERLWQFEGRDCTIYFDPLAEWPVKGTITLKGSRQVICIAECINTYGESKDRAAEVVKANRQTMMSETRVILTRHTERTLRHSQGVIVTATGAPATPSQAPQIPDTWDQEFQCEFVGRDPSETPSRDLPAAPSQDPRVTSAQPPRVTREDLGNSLSRRARLARESAVKI